MRARSVRIAACTRRASTGTSPKLPAATTGKNCAEDGRMDRLNFGTKCTWILRGNSGSYLPIALRKDISKGRHVFICRSISRNKDMVLLMHGLNHPLGHFVNGPSEIHHRRRWWLLDSQLAQHALLQSVPWSTKLIAVRLRVEGSPT